MNRKPASTADYLAALDPEKRAALEDLRAIIQAAAPEARECISYQLPAFRQGRILVCYGAAAKHCALYPMSAVWVREHASELAGYSTSKGTIRFQPDKPLPKALVEDLVRTRLAQNAARDEAKKAR